MPAVARLSCWTHVTCALRWVAWLLTLGSAMGCADIAERETDESLAQPILGGATDEACAWPAVVSLGGCTGTLINERLVVYAAHCGTAIDEVRFGVDAAHPEQVAAVDFCGAYPNARLGDGSDLAYCMLSTPPQGVRPARVLAGCEASELTLGREVALVGFGIDGDGAVYGRQRSARSTITSVGDELLIASDGVDTCRGDSGGPVFMQILAARGEPEWRLVGVTSAGSEQACSQGTGHYVSLLPKIDWLEDASGMDVTPCFDRGVWSPTPECVSQPPTCSPTRDVQLLDSCGAAWQPRPAPSSSIHFAIPAGPVFQVRLLAGQSYFETAVELTVDGAGAGLRGVDFTLRDPTSAVLVSRTDQVAPYGLPALRLPPGQYWLEAQALDFAGRSASDRIGVEVSAATAATAAPGCTMAGAGSASGVPTFELLLLACASFKGCRRRRQLCHRRRRLATY